MNMIDPFLKELDHEAATTRRLLERAPQARLGWQPHAKSMTLGRLAGHIAEIPAWISAIVQQDEFNMTDEGHNPLVATAIPDLLAIYDKNIQQARGVLAGQSNDRLLATWRFKRNGKLLFELPRVGVIRSFFLNHVIHHRGQLSVYLRLLDVPVPSIYGPSADETM